MLVKTYTYRNGTGWDLFPDRGLDSDQTLLLSLFPSTFGDFARPLNYLRDAFSKSCWIGCSTAGHFSDNIIEDDTFLLVVVKFEATGLESVTTRFTSTADSRDAGVRVASALPREGLRGVMVFADWKDLNGSALVDGMESVLGREVALFGGLAGDGERFGETLVLSGTAPASHTVSAVGFYGDRFHLTVNTHGGWDWIGPQRRVTHSEGNTLYTLDGKPALAVYKRYLGGRAAELPAAGLLFPLGVHSDGNEDCEILRVLYSVDEERGAITFCGDIPQGSYVRLMHANRERLIDAAVRSTDRALWSLTTNDDALAIIASCVGRRMILGADVVEEVSAARNLLPRNCAMAGLFSYGEIAPTPSGNAMFHNQTFTVGILQET